MEDARFRVHRPDVQTSGAAIPHPCRIGMAPPDGAGPDPSPCAKPADNGVPESGSRAVGVGCHLTWRRQAAERVCLADRED